MSKDILHLPRARGGRRHTRSPGSASEAAPSAPATSGDPAAPEGQPNGGTTISAEERQAMIAEAAYFRAERRGFEPGYERDDWLAAERDIERALPQPPALQPD